MITLSRREETDILERGKEEALRSCDDLVKDFAECAKGRTVTVLWSCGGAYNSMRKCMKEYLTVDKMDQLKADHMENREERNAEALERAQKKFQRR